MGSYEQLYNRKKITMKNNKFKNTMLALLTTLMLVMSAGVGAADGSDPLDPSDGGADWDGDGLTNSEEQTHGTNMNNADSDGDGLPDGWEVSMASTPPTVEMPMQTLMAMDFPMPKNMPRNKSQ